MTSTVYKGKGKPNGKDVNNMEEGRVGDTDHTTKTSRLQQTGAKVAQSGDFMARISALVVLAVTSFNTILATVTYFTEEIWWAASLNLALLLFVHLPVLVGMLVLICKARVKQAIVKIGPARKSKHNATIASNNAHDHNIFTVSKGSPGHKRTSPTSTARSSPTKHQDDHHTTTETGPAGGGNSMARSISRKKR